MVFLVQSILMDIDLQKTTSKVKRELADFLGIGMEDVEDDSFFLEDFHMGAVEMTDFMDILEKAGFETDNIDLTEIETFSDLVEELNDKH